jgi:3-phenylpropionate/trans-cinnamate dioxygenase ferredoxin reductase component
VGVVIVGAGHAGFQTAASLRAEGYQESIRLIGDEPHLPYQRPPLSKGMLLGKQEMRHATLRPAAFYESQRIDVLLGERAASIDTAGQNVILASGRQVRYEHLVLATGARNRMLPIDGALYLRTLDESTELRQRLSGAQYVAIIGGGFIGLEVAAAARLLGKKVTVVEVQPRLLARVVAPVVSEYFRQRHTEEGVHVLLNRGLSELGGADLIVAGVGVAPNTELARDAGLEVGNGIAVDEYLRTADPRIFAIGDCAEYPNPFAPARIRLESVQNAVDQAVCVARAITGNANPYGAAPWFWSDQFDIRLQIAGVATGYDQVVTRGAPESRKFSAFYYRQSQLVAIDSINRPAEHLQARKIIAARASISPEQAADESFDLKMV